MVITTGAFTAVCLMLIGINKNWIPFRFFGYLIAWGVIVLSFFTYLDTFLNGSDALMLLNHICFNLLFILVVSRGLTKTVQEWRAHAKP